MNKFKVITIERQYASGGRIIGNLVAEKLGIPCYGREILEITAKRYNISPESIEHIEETTTNSLLYSLAMASKIVSGVTDAMSPNDRLFCAESEVITELAEKERCIIIGRCAGRVLSERDDCLSVFIYADNESRVKRAVEDYNISKDEAESVLRKFDKRRSSFYNANSDIKWEEMSGYHICLDSGRLGVEACADVIAQIYKGQ